MSITYQLSGMHCGACVAKVTKALQPLASQVDVSLNPQQVSLQGPSASMSDLQAALSAIGKYEISVLPKALTTKAAEPVVSAPTDSAASWFKTYFPLLLILAFILGASVLVQLGLQVQNSAFLTGSLAVSLSETMRYFMAGFFLVFAFFKLLDLRAFANVYQSYDLLSAKWPAWGLIYPFVELGLGAAYLANLLPTLTNALTLVVMGFSALGVIRAVLNKSQIQCACLGTVFKLPMSTVTIIEDLGMVVMAAAMLVMANGST
jgi:copper chaperone CopZ